MGLHEIIVSKIRDLPEHLVQEVNDFVDFLIIKHDRERWQLWLQFAEAMELAESDLADYVSNLEAYEERLARGEIQW